MGVIARRSPQFHAFARQRRAVAGAQRHRNGGRAHAVRHQCVGGQDEAGIEGVNAVEVEGAQADSRACAGIACVDAVAARECVHRGVHGNAPAAAAAAASISVAQSGGAAIAAVGADAAAALQHARLNPEGTAGTAACAIKAAEAAGNTVAAERATDR